MRKLPGDSITAGGADAEASQETRTMSSVNPCSTRGEIQICLRLEREFNGAGDEKNGDWKREAATLSRFVNKDKVNVHKHKHKEHAVRGIRIADQNRKSFLLSWSQL